MGGLKGNEKIVADQTYTDHNLIKQTAHTDIYHILIVHQIARTKQNTVLGHFKWMLQQDCFLPEKNKGIQEVEHTIIQKFPFDGAQDFEVQSLQRFLLQEVH